MFRDQRLKIPQVAKTEKVKQNKTETESSSKFIAKVKDSSGNWVIADSSTTPVSSTRTDVSQESSRVQARYFYTHENFYVITRYNHSVLYAMAVHDLSQAIDAAMRAR